MVQGHGSGTKREVFFDYQGSLAGIRSGTIIYIDDGRIALEVTRRQRRRLTTRVVIPGLLKERKGINIPDAHLDFDVITAKDRCDLDITLEHKLDYLAQSFVRTANDIKRLKKLVLPGHPTCRIFAKIESREALANVDRIIDISDGIIVARGDLGICVPVYKVPFIQKELVKKCRKKHKPVIVATQMLESMTEERMPTRAEVSDVANAIVDGATHVMLSGETSVGRHPHEVVAMMNAIIAYAERYQR
jgi:pyruvate kinase